MSLAARIEVSGSSFPVGVKGYLEQQDLLSQTLLDGIREIVKPAEADLDLVVTNVLNAGKFATAAEIKARETQKLAILGRASIGETLSEAAEAYNSRAIAAADRARGLLKAALDKLDDSNSA